MYKYKVLYSNNTELLIHIKYMVLSNVYDALKLISKKKKVKK